MISVQSALKVTCPVCGAGRGVPCIFGHRGKARAQQHPRRISRAMEEKDFWNWVDERLADPTCSMTEQELLDSISLPGWTGRKARNSSARVVQMPARDFKMAAAGDGDEAA